MYPHMYEGACQVPTSNNKPFNTDYDSDIVEVFVQKSEVPFISNISKQVCCLLPISI